MKIAKLVVGGVLFVIGFVWFLQGVNILPPHASRGQDILLGGGLVLIGSILTFLSFPNKNK